MSNVPWPLWIGLLFPIYVAAVSVAIWILRGRVWPVRCARPDWCFASCRAPPRRRGNGSRKRLKKPAADSRPEAIAGSARTDVAEGLERVVNATRFAMIAFVTAILLTGTAVLADGPTQTVLQYLATLGFVLAWAATNSGIYRRSTNWLRGACLQSLKWWSSIFVPVGVLNLVFTVANKAPAA
ncbi:hypothetical protein [Amycolatopsis sp. WGS_07]|uniref:hypothetical protein n=1 Tax=Amycolatopsis sp. WGS_07 TaxID=3076764 RepID=UPI003873AA72